VVAPLLAVALVLVASAALLLLALAARRIVLARETKRRAESERRLRPVAIGLLEGDGGKPPRLAADDQAVLADLLGRYSRKLRGDAELRIAEYFRDSPALETALSELGSRRMWRRARAAYRLGDMACPDVAPALRAALDDRAREVRAAAARSLGRLHAADSALPLVEALVSHRVPAGVGGQALFELGTDAVPELSHIAAHPDPHVRAAAITLLGLVGDNGNSRIAVDGLGDPSADVRRAAAEALARIGTSSAEPALRATLDDRVHVVRASAAEALGAIDAAEALPKLVEIARNDRFRPARAAAQAIGRIDPARLRTAAAEADAGPHLHEASDLLAM
jgi:hypothetical protein